MNKEEKIIRYIENELTSGDRDAFEEELNSSSELRKEFDKYLHLKNETLELKKVKLDNLYLDSIIPEFRAKLQTTKSPSIRLNFGYAVGIMLIFVFSVAIINYFLSEKSTNTDLPEFAESLDENQRLELLENLDYGIIPTELVSENVSINEIDEIINAEFEFSSEVIETYKIDNDDLIVGLGQDEINKIYNEILNRNF
ncbi:MAG: hypothetical protein IPM14_16100 [bacterium]|nr:hypothetical protein [bacterium]